MKKNFSNGIIKLKPFLDFADILAFVQCNSCANFSFITSEFTTKIRARSANTKIHFHREPLLV